MDTRDEGQTASVRRARAIYETLEAERDSAIAERAAKSSDGEPEPATTPVAKRIRYTHDSKGRPTIDVSKADKECPHCAGTGRRPDQHIEDDDTGEVIALPVVCRCVKANGGVKKDLLDKMAAGAIKRARWDDRRKARRRRKNRQRRRRGRGTRR